RLREEEAARVGHDAKREAFERVSAEVSSLEEAARELRTMIHREREALSQAELALRESELRLGHLDDSIREKWGVEIATWEPPVADAEPAEAVVPETPPDAAAEAPAG